MDLRLIYYLCQALDAFQEAVGMYDDHIRLHGTCSLKAFPHDKRALDDNFNILQMRLKLLHDQQEDLAKDLRQVNDYNRELDLEMNSLKPEIIRLYKQREQHQSWLLSHGARVEEVNKLLVQSSREMPHNDEKSWLMRDVDRPKVKLYCKVNAMVYICFPFCPYFLASFDQI